MSSCQKCNLLCSLAVSCLSSSLIISIVCTVHSSHSDRQHPLDPINRYLCLAEGGGGVHILCTATRRKRSRVTDDVTPTDPDLSIMQTVWDNMKRQKTGRKFIHHSILPANNYVQMYAAVLVLYMLYMEYRFTVKKILYFIVMYLLYCMYKGKEIITWTKICHYSYTDYKYRLL